MFKLHDWTLLSVNYDWEQSKCTLLLHGSDSKKELIARNVSDLHVPRRDDWGPSVSVNSAKMEEAGGSKTLTIEMQSGDVIVVIAGDFSLEPA